MNWAWFDGNLGTGLQLGLEVEETLYEDATGQHHLAIYQTRRFGRALALDGVIQTTEGDEFVYHEMLAHVPLIAHGGAARVCVIGGGDGGMLREVLKHPVASARLVEVDAKVIELARVYLPRLSDGAFDDARVAVEIADGARFVAETDERFDVIIVDSTDPIGPGEALFTSDFCGGCRRCLNDGGILATQNGVPMLQPEDLTASTRRLREHFTDVTCYLAAVPTYSGGVMAFGWASDDPRARQHSQDTLAGRFAALGFTTRYYNPAVHVAAFALPNNIAALLT